MPKHLLNKKKPVEAQQENTSKYPSSAVKMLVTAVDDLHMVKFKAGWFTLIKYNYEFEKNPTIKAEMKEWVGQQDPSDL